MKKVSLSRREKIIPMLIHLTKFGPFISSPVFRDETGNSILNTSDLVLKGSIFINCLTGD